MKIDLFYSDGTRLLVVKEGIEYIKENNVRIINGTNSSFFLFNTEEKYNDFISKFNIPENCVCVVKKYSKDEYFTYYSKNSDPDTVINGEIVAEENGFLGEGVYCIREEEFLSKGMPHNNIKSLINSLPEQQNCGIKDVAAIFVYRGPYYICMHGKGREGIVNLLVPVVKEDNIIVAFEETIELITEEYEEMECENAIG